MIRYDLVDKLNNVFELNGEGRNVFMKGSFTAPSEAFTIEHKIEEKSAGAGAVALGESRMHSRTLSLTYQLLDPSDTTFRDEINELIAFIVNVRYFVDRTNEMRVRARVTAYSVEYDSGSHKLSGTVNMDITLLDPFWEDLEEKTVTQSIAGGDQDPVPFTVSGFFPIQPTLIFVASEACPTIDMYLDKSVLSDRVGINISDSLLGTSEEYDTLEINCKEGTCVIEDLDRSQNIEEGTGYFDVGIGDNSLIVNPAGDVDLTISWRERYFL